MVPQAVRHVLEGSAARGRGTGPAIGKRDGARLTSPYPAAARDRDRWILAQRPAKAASLDTGRAYAAGWEEERDGTGTLQPTAVVFLTNQECPFRCLMCDLWRHTLDRRVGQGDIPAQIRGALEGLPPARQIKLYNAGSFFDPRAIPPEDDDAIAEAVAPFDRVIVEAHPAFLEGVHGRRCLRMRDRLEGSLEVAVGLETAHEDVLARLNKQMTVASFRRAADFLSCHGIDMRVFILLRPPFMSEAEGVEWGCRSLDLAAACGASVCSIIPTRRGNGAMEALGDDAAPPSLASLETVVEYGISLGRGRVFADLWEIDRFFTCACAPARVDRLRAMNHEQRPLPPVVCGCGA